MADHAILIDFGSTFTKVTAVDLVGRRIAARAQSPSTVSTDVAEGLTLALQMLAQRPGSSLAGRGPGLDDLLADDLVLASSSAAGGLRMAVIGNVPGLTGAAAKATALGAGAKIVGTFSFKLRDDDVAALRALAPDMILLTGGVDGGDVGTIRHNARRLANAGLGAPVVVAGNASAASEIAALFETAGLEFACVANVMPAIDRLELDEARREIQRLFMHNIVESKGLEQFGRRVPNIVPTPMAVFEGARLIGTGCNGRPGFGDLLLVDIGGATTDVHSIGFGRHSTDEIIPGGMPEPFAKRTVEGDLGLRINAATILERVGADMFATTFAEIFPEFAIEKDALLAYVDGVARQTHNVPQTDWQSAADATLARIAADIAIERHVGRREPYHSRNGTIYLQSGKDLTEVGLLIGTGGVFAHNTYGDRILHCGDIKSGVAKVLRPVGAQILIDADYILYAVGILADTRPDVALDIFEHHFRKPDNLARTASADENQDHGELCACCGGDWGGPSQWRLGRRSKPKSGSIAGA